MPVSVADLTAHWIVQVLGLDAVGVDCNVQTAAAVLVSFSPAVEVCERVRPAELVGVLISFPA